MSILFGVDYYPEHWSKERWKTDVSLMQEMGLQVVRMGEFSWSKLEPELGKFQFDWLDEAIELLADYGIKTILGTPTAAPPAWIIEQAPEIQPVDNQERQRHFGGRHHDCQSNPIYREHIRRYVTAFAAHFGGNPNVIGWQVDNELGNSHNELCMCESCERRFQQWLEKKYKTVHVLNEQWGTIFWSQQYQKFSQVQAPKITASGQNPSQLLDWKRFCSDLVLEFHKFQADILRTAAPQKFITHNMMGFSEKVSYFELGKDLDFASHDQYPGGHFHWDQNVFKADRLAAELDFVRGVKQKPFWIMEQQAGITGWEILGRAPKPGELGLWATQSVAHGADTIVFFRWRSCTVGTEQYWHGLLPHNGVPGRYFNEIKDWIHKSRPLMEELQGSVPEAKTAILFSYDQEYAIDIQPHHPKLSYIGNMLVYYRALFEQNVPVNFINEQEDFSKFDLIIAPLQYLMSEELSNKYKEYVKNGGTLLLTMRSGVKDKSNICMTEAPLPGPLCELTGLYVEEYDCLRETSAFVLWDGERLQCEKWCDIIKTTTAETLAVYDSEFYAGTPAITVNKFGSGNAYYICTEPDHIFADKLIGELLKSASITPLLSTPHGVEAVHRTIGNKKYMFVLNHTDEVKSVKIPEDWISYYEGQSEHLPPFSANIYTVNC